MGSATAVERIFPGGRDTISLRLACLSCLTIQIVKQNSLLAQEKIKKSSLSLMVLILSYYFSISFDWCLVFYIHYLRYSRMYMPYFIQYRLSVINTYGTVSEI